MEDPIQFDLWGHPVPEARRRLAEQLAAQLSSGTRIQILGQIIRAIAEKSSLRFAGPLGWAAAQRLRHENRDLFQQIQVFQAGYGPVDAEKINHCKIHDLFYGGCLGCPVCNGMNDP